MSVAISTRTSCRKAFVWGWHSPGAVEAIGRLVAAGRLEVPLWIRDGKNGTIDPRALIYRFELPGVARVTNRMVLPLAPADLMTFADMYSRVSRAAGMSMQELMHTCYSYCHYFASALEEHGIDLVMFAVPPHYGPDYLLYIVAKAFGVETVLCHQSLFPNRFFHARNLDDMGHYKQVVPASLETPLTIPRDFRKELFYMNKVRVPNTRPVGSLINDLRKQMLWKDEKPLRLAGVFQKFTESREYLAESKRQISTDVDLDQPYVYFPLQLQPEMTTSALGRGFSDQLTAIECISRLIPPGWKILVKENPKQTYRQRGGHFFARLASIRNVVYVDRKISTYALLEKAHFVATVTGTAGWEAISGGKPALVFGQPWYAGLPGVITYDSQVRLDDILNQVISHDELTVAFNSRLANTRLGVLDPHYAKIVPSFSPEENSRHLENFLSDVIAGRAYEQDGN